MVCWFRIRSFPSGVFFKLVSYLSLVSSPWSVSSCCFVSRTRPAVSSSLRVGGVPHLLSPSAYGSSSSITSSQMGV